MSSTTSNISAFNKPAFDESLLLPQWFEYNALHSPDQPLFVYETDLGSNIVKTITWEQGYRGYLRASRLVAPYVNVAGENRDKNYSPPVLAILANLDSVTYYSLIAGIMLAGGVVFPISVRNSALAIRHLLAKSKATTLFVSPDEQMQTLAAAALESGLGEGDEDHQITLATTPAFQDIFPSDGLDLDKKFSPLVLPAFIGLETPALYLHSSGSTSFPKIIPITHRVLLQWGRATQFGEADIGEHRIASHAAPVFHAMGIMVWLWAACSGLTLGEFPPRNPPIMPSASNVLAGALATKCSVVFVVPSFVESWSRSAEDTKKLTTFHAVGFGGGPLNPGIGDELTRKGVALWNFYGATEFGIVSINKPRAPGGPEWQYVELASYVNPKYLPGNEPNTYEIAFVDTDHHTPSVYNTLIDGKSAYASSDIVSRHPTNPHKVKILGRADDQIMLSTGEKTNPGPLEAIVCRNPLVAAAVMFGRGREQNGILVQPVCPVDAKDKFAMAKFRNDIWPSVEEANTFAPKHSRVFKEMILITDPEKPFELTVKGTVKKNMTITAYASEIEAAYIAVEESSQSDIVPPVDWTHQSVLEYVRNVVYKVMQKNISDEDDIFQHGGDSLQATWIRNTLLRALRESHITEQAANVSQGFVYASPTIASLTTSLLVLCGTSVNGAIEDPIQLKLDAIDALIKEFTADFPKHQPAERSYAKPSGEVVLLTGTTGGLGAQLLVYLANSADISRVYAFNRPASRSLRERQTEVLVDRGFDASILDEGKIVLVEGKTEDVRFGLESELYDEIKINATLVIHNAWRVNWVLSVASFKPLIRGVRNMVDFALSSPHEQPPRIIYTSSIGVFSNWSSTSAPLESSIDPRTCLSSGYTESKFVSERILEAAAAETSLRPVIVRVGQMTGTQNGAWNKGDWVPALVRSGQVLQALPAREDLVAWLSLDAAARAIFDFRNSHSQFLHLANPRPYPWMSAFEPFAKELGVPLVPWTEWLYKLEKSADAPDAAEKNPAVMLLKFFRSLAPEAVHGREAPGIAPVMDMQEALKASEHLRGLNEAAGEKDVQKWVAYWRKCGLLNV